jgi:hypothetical protein
MWFFAELTKKEILDIIHRPASSPETGAELSRFQQKTGTESSLKNVVF